MVGWLVGGLYVVYFGVIVLSSDWECACTVKLLLYWQYDIFS